MDKYYQPVLSILIFSYLTVVMIGREEFSQLIAIILISISLTVVILSIKVIKERKKDEGDS